MREPLQYFWNIHSSFQKENRLPQNCQSCDIRVFLRWKNRIMILEPVHTRRDISGGRVRCARVSLSWKLVLSHETGISRLDYPVNQDNYYPCERSALVVVRMTSIRTWKSQVEIAGAKCEHAQYARRNPFNWYRTIAKRESIEKTDKTKFLLNTMHLVRLKYNCSRVLLWRGEIARGNNPLNFHVNLISGVRDISPSCEIYFRNDEEIECVLGFSISYLVLEIFRFLKHTN